MMVLVEISLVQISKVTRFDYMLIEVNIISAWKK